MSAIDLERFMARLFADGDFRARFAAARDAGQAESVFQGFELGAAERQSLLDWDPIDLETAARGYARKREIRYKRASDRQGDGSQ